MTTSFDLLVIGADEASLAAAAVAARSGVATALLRSPKQKTTAVSFCDIPNFVWRRLDLHEYGLIVEPVSSRVTLAPDGEKLTTYKNLNETKSTLAKFDGGDHLIWANFVDEMKNLDAAYGLQETAANVHVNGGGAFRLFTGDVRALSSLTHAASNCKSLLDDYFQDEALKMHVAAHALSSMGLGGHEPGSALALAEFFDDHAWRVRADEDSPSLLSTLETVCRNSGVQIIENKLAEVSTEGGKHRTITLSGGEKIKAGIVFFASPGAAQTAGVRASVSPLAGHGAAKAILRISLKTPMKSMGAGDSAIYQILDRLDDLQKARDNVMDGRLPDNLPVEFEVAPNGDIIVQTAYCPAAFREEDGWREWTGQDRQAVARRMIDQLSSRISGFGSTIRKSKLTVIGAESPDRPAVFTDLENVIVQPSRHNAVAQAVRLVDKVFASV